jgi:3-hydroxyisobutyrate dehydrogenase-like beta-hydroxyacid dehydrogenase
MGSAMLRHLLSRGYSVVACDLAGAQTDMARALGATIAETPSALGRNSDFVIIGVGYDDEVNDVVLGPDGLLETLSAGSLIAVCSTVAPDMVKALDRAAGAKGIDVLDAPICRGRFAADAGTLLALLGGPDKVVERARPVFESFCSDIAHLGAVGHGQVGKAMNNFLLWVNGVALIEAGRLATSTGIDLPRLRDALLMSSGNSAALQDWDMITFTWALKDMQIVSAMADEAGLSLPLAGAIRELVKDARRIKAEKPPPWTASPSS